MVGGGEKSVREWVEVYVPKGKCGGGSKTWNHSNIPTPNNKKKKKKKKKKRQQSKKKKKKKTGT